jgi:hypothetical protein
MAPAALMKAYIQQLNKSESGPVKALAQKKLTGGSMKENFNIDALASSSVANALFKVFVEGVEKEEYVLGEEYLEELMKRNERGEALYSVKVYYKNGTTYVRWSDREDMARIRSNPNVKSIEMVDYAPPQDQQGSRSSKKDYDGDGKVESGAKEYRGSVHNAIQRNKGGTPDGRDTSSVKEDLDFIGEGKKKDKKQFGVMRGSNTKRIKMFPESGKVAEEVVLEDSYSKFLNMIQEKTLTPPETEKKEQIASALKSKYGKTPKTYAIATSVAKKVAEETACDSSKPEKDMRGDYAEKNNIKNRLRSALGVKNPIVMTPSEEKYSSEEVELEGEMIDERRREEKGTPRKPRDRAFELVANSVGSNRLGVQPRGQRKEPGKKPPEAGEYGSERRSPEQIVRNRRAARQQGRDNMSSRFD